MSLYGNGFVVQEAASVSVSISASADCVEEESNRLLIISEAENEQRLRTMPFGTLTSTANDDRLAQYRTSV